MKILLLNPHLDAGHEIAQALQAKGAGLLFAENASEAWQILQLHGESLGIALIHREGPTPGDFSGLDFVKRVKSDQAQAELPLVITSDRWGDTEFALHQASPHGANAYLKYPFSTSELMKVITAVTGWGDGEISIPTAVDHAVEAPLSLTPEFSGQAPAEAPVLEFSPDETSSSLDATRESSPGMIMLELPSFEGASEPAEGAVVEAETPPAESPVEFEPQAQELEFQDPEIAEEPAVEPGPSFETQSPESGQGQGQGPGDDEQIRQEMPYLFGSNERTQGRLTGAIQFPLGDAVVPGGAAHSPDVETLKKYLMLREQDVAVLSAQLNTARDQMQQLEETLRKERSRTIEFEHVTQELTRRIGDFEKEKSQAIEALQAEMEEMKFQIKFKADKARSLESQFRDATDEAEKIKERVRMDIRKIRTREKELENRLEIMKKDSEALIGARENKIMELKRKLDLLEFNMDLLQSRYAKEKENTLTLKERLSKAAQVVRAAGGLLDTQGEAKSEARHSESSSDEGSQAAS